MQLDRLLLTLVGLGDFIAFEAFISDQERSKVGEIYFATPAQSIIEPFVDAAFPNLQKKIVLFNDWTPGCIIDDKSTLLEWNDKEGLGLDKDLISQLIDLNVRFMFWSVSNGRPYTGSRFLSRRLADISHFSLPEHFGIIQPYTPSYEEKRREHRDFDERDWASVLRFLEKMNEHAVVINRSDDPIPEHPLIHNLNQQTTITEAAEICKHGNFYIGIDSWVPALMSKFLIPQRMIIKTFNLVYKNNIKFFCAPHKEFPNVFQTLDGLA